LTGKRKKKAVELVIAPEAVIATKCWWELPILGALIFGALLLRIVGQLDKVFVNGNVWFRGVDSWYHMRLADSTVVNFPSFPSWDMFAKYPAGTEVGYLPLLSWVVALLGKIGNYEVAAAFLPTVLGALTLIPIYLVGREVFSGKVGLLACLLIAVLPGEFFHRTMLGFTDHHAFESLLMATTLLFFLYAYRTLKWRWMTLSGVSLGLYHLAWAGTSFFLLIIGIWMWFEFLRRYKHNEPIHPLCLMVTVPVGIGLLISFPYLGKESLLISSGLLGLSAVLWLLTRFVKDREYVLFGLTLLAPAGLVVLGFFQSWHSLIVTIFWGGSTYIQEAAPLTPTVLFATYGISFFLMLGGLWFCPREKSKGLFLIWCIVLIIAAVGQRRWGYYTAIPVSLLATYFAFYLTKWVSPRVRVAVVVVVALFLLIPNVNNTVRLVWLPNAITSNWYVALTWLEKYTPNPFENENAYYDQGSREKASYGILSWWDYGHWVIRISKRVPTDSPTLASGAPARFFASKTVEEAERHLKGLNIRYIVIDSTLLTGKWHAVPRRAGKEPFNVEESVLWQLWTEQLDQYKKVFERSDIKIFERG